MKASIRVAVFVLGSAAAAGAQAPIDGVWTGEIASDGNTRPLALTLTTNGDKLTGSITGVGNEVSIQDGVISGATVTFKTTQRLDGGTDQTVSCTGTILADELQFSCAANDAAAQEFVVHRQQ